MLQLFGILSGGSAIPQIGGLCGGGSCPPAGINFILCVFSAGGCVPRPCGKGVFSHIIRFLCFVWHEFCCNVLPHGQADCKQNFDLRNKEWGDFNDPRLRSNERSLEICPTIPKHKNVRQKAVYGLRIPYPPIVGVVCWTRVMARRCVYAS